MGAKIMKTCRVIYLLIFLVFTSGCYWACNKSPTAPQDKKQKPLTHSQGLFFDDFDYQSVSDPALAKFGWNVRSGSGGPGPADCTWDDTLITFAADTANVKNRLMHISAWTQGSGATCHQAEIYTARKFMRATYAARVLFTDTPESGDDVDGVVQTFFTIAPWNVAYLDEYCEFDFEYLPNGGWGRNGSTLWETSWETVELSRSFPQNASHAGAWQTLLIQADTVETKYYVNNELRVTHPKPYVVDGSMSINFNHWFIADKLKSQNTGTRTYTYYVDWVFAQADSILSQETVDARILEIRSKGYKRVDNVKAD
jgi:hypothetical protein